MHYIHIPTLLAAALLAGCLGRSGGVPAPDQAQAKGAWASAREQAQHNGGEDAPAPKQDSPAPKAQADALTGEGLARGTFSSQQILRRTAYTASYNSQNRLPNWVAWRLTAAHADGPYNRKGQQFAEDEEVPTPRATNMDYVRSGYDRGHMFPAGDAHWSEQVMTESFLYTNCCPQLHALNGGDWKELEERCRQWAVDYGSIYIVCGPLLYNKRHKTIGRSKVVVPEAFFKVVMTTKGGGRAIGFIYKNNHDNLPMRSYVNTVDEVERLTGIDFFPALPDDTEKRIEATADLNDWK